MERINQRSTSRNQLIFSCLWGEIEENSDERKITLKKVKLSKKIELTKNKKNIWRR